MNDFLKHKELYHYGVKGQKWGIRRYQNEDGSLTKEGMKLLEAVGKKNGFTSTVDEEASKKGKPLLMYTEDVARYYEDIEKVDKILKDLAKEEVYIDKSTVTFKNGEKYLAYAFENGKKMEDMKKRSVFYYNIRTDKGGF